MEIFGKHIHTFKVFKRVRSGIYRECTDCGHRKVGKWRNGVSGHAPPVNQNWLNGGDWDFVPSFPAKPAGNLNQGIEIHEHHYR